MAYHAIIIAGFGGQGIMLTGQIIAAAAVIEGKNSTWLPSYGPEMRGGTANCTVIVDEKPITSPVRRSSHGSNSDELSLHDEIRSKTQIWWFALGQFFCC